MRDTLKSLASLMSAAFLVQGSNAAITTMIGVATALRGGSQGEVALIAACYSLGFLVGCFLAPPKIQRFGLIRAFAASAAFLTITILIFEILAGSGAWAALRFMMGVSVATVLAVSDTWINAKTPGDKRGRVIAIYSTILGLGSIASQIVFLFLDSTTGGIALLFAISMNMAVVFVAMATADAPVVPVREKGSTGLFTRVALASGVSAFAGGFIVTSIVAVTPFSLAARGVSENMVAGILASLYLGRLLFQFPMGIVSDRFDRRLVLAGLFIGLCTMSIFGLLIGAGGGRHIIHDPGFLTQVTSFILLTITGGLIYPIHSIATALAFDRAPEGAGAETSTTLLALNSAGAVAGPFLVMLAGRLLGDAALWSTMLVVSAAAAFISLAKGIYVPQPWRRTAVENVSPTSMEMAHVAAELAKEQTEEQPS